MTTARIAGSITLTKTNKFQYKHFTSFRLHRRSFFRKNLLLSIDHGEILTYYTGIGYLSGAVIGAGKGFVEGVKASEPGNTMKLRINRILNGSGHTSQKFRNRAGVIGLIYAGMERGMLVIRDTDDIINSVVAGLGTGAFYRAASGLRSAAMAGVIGGVVVGLGVTGKQALKRYVPI